MAALEGSAGGRVPLDPAVGVALAGRALRRRGTGVASGCARSTRVAGGTVAGFGAGLTSVRARFAAGNGAARIAGAGTLAGGGADGDGGEDEGEEESAHTQGLSAEQGNCLIEVLVLTWGHACGSSCHRHRAGGGCVTTPRLTAELVVALSRCNHKT